MSLLSGLTNERESPCCCCVARAPAPLPFDIVMDVPVGPSVMPLLFFPYHTRADFPALVSDLPQAKETRHRLPDIEKDSW